MRQCKRCGKLKAETDFYEKGHSKGRAKCRACHNEIGKEYRIKNKEKEKERHRKYRLNNLERIKENRKKWEAENKDARKEYFKEYRIKNKEKQQKYFKEYYKAKAKFKYSNQIDFCEETRRDPKDKSLLQVKCTNCEEWFNPTNREVKCRIQSLNKCGRGERRFYCSTECKQSCSIYYQKKYPAGFRNTKDDRPDQREWATAVKERDDYICQKCDSTENLIAHHFEGWHVNPIIFLDIDNGITLCENCHAEAHSDIGCRYVDLKKESICETTGS